MTFERQVLETALDQLLNHSPYFCIVDLRKIGDLLGVDVQRHPNYKFLSALHCVHYSKMPLGVRQEIPQRVMECLRPDTVNVSHMASMLTMEGSHGPIIEDTALPHNALRLTKR